MHTIKRNGKSELEQKLLNGIKTDIVAASVADTAAAINPNDIKMLLANDLSTFLLIQILVTFQEVCQKILLIANFRQLSF